MKWTDKDLQQYIGAKEYVDTVVIPLLPFQLSHDNNLAKDALQREALSVFAGELEKELTGRVMLIPEYNYLKTADKVQETERINTWVENIQSQPFPYIFYLTSDSAWKKREQELNGTLIWLPGMAKGSIRSEEMQAVIKNQVEQVGEFIKSYWLDDEED